MTMSKDYRDFIESWIASGHASENNTNCLSITSRKKTMARVCKDEAANLGGL